MYEFGTTEIMVVVAGISYLGWSYYQLKQENERLMAMISDLASQHFAKEIKKAVSYTHLTLPTICSV